MKIVDVSDTRTEVEFKDRKITIIGTAHISSESVKEVEAFIRDENPDSVCIEIDESRYKSIVEGKSWENMNLIKVFREKKGFLLLTNLVLASFQKKLGADIGNKSGAEMIEAVNLCKELDKPFYLVDREIHTTLRRAWRKSSFWNKLKLLSALLSSAFSKEELSSEDIEDLKDKSALDGMMGELADYLPSVKEVLIDERDRFLASKVYDTPGKNVMAVVGAGHVPGMLEWMKSFEEEVVSTDVEEIDFVPNKRFGEKLAPWILPVLIIGTFIGGFFVSGKEATLELMVKWVLINGVLSAVGGIIALGNPLTILVAFVAAPITSLNPLFGVGFITGPLEAVLRKPKVVDFNNLGDDAGSIKGFYRNRITRILLVFLLTSIGSSIGTFIGAAPLIPMFADVVKAIAGFISNLF